MAKKPKAPAEDHSNDWLNTYADMVTLLLTFFVMLYASSNLDELKWQYIYQAFQSRGRYVNNYVDVPDPNAISGDNVTDADPQFAGGAGEMPQSFDQLYLYLTQFVTENDLDSVVSVEQGAAHINIRFNNSVLFAPDSAELTREGQQIILKMSAFLSAVEESIQRVTVNGHTAKAFSNSNDWDLSADRACSVVKLMEFNRVFADSDRYRVGGFGPTEPIADNSTEEGRAENRRVEMVILKSDADMTNPEVLKDLLKFGYGFNMEQFDPFGNNTSNVPKLPSDSAQAIIDSIESRYPDSSPQASGDIIGPFIPADYDSFLVIDTSEADNGAGAGAAGSEE